MNAPVTRRQFASDTLRTAAAVATGATLLNSRAAEGQTGFSIGINALDVMRKHGPLTDQYSRNFDLSSLTDNGVPSRGKPFILIFGFNGCQRCGHIATFIAGVQKGLLESGNKTSIAVLSIHPEDDSKDMESYIDNYKRAGVKQLADESNNPDVSSYKKGEDVAASKRALHLLTTKDTASVHAIHEELRLIRQRNNDDSHAPLMLVCNNKGIITKTFLADYDPQKPEDVLKSKKSINEAVKYINEISKIAPQSSRTSMSR